MSNDENAHIEYEADSDSRVGGLGATDADAFAEARAVLADSADSGEKLAEDFERACQRQQGLIVAWARRTGRMIADAEFDAFALVSNSTSAHEVRYRAGDNRAVKRTWAGVYGQIPARIGAKLDRRLATPLEYIDRMTLQNRVFASTFRLEGVNVSERPSMIIGQPAGQPSFIVSQEWADAADAEAPHPTDGGVAGFMERHGFVAIPGSYFGWQRAADGVVVVDAKRDNFILTSEGIVPIDLQMAQIEEEAITP